MKKEIKRSPLSKKCGKHGGEMLNKKMRLWIAWNASSIDKRGSRRAEDFLRQISQYGHTWAYLQNLQELHSEDVLLTDDEETAKEAAAQGVYVFGLGESGSFDEAAAVFESDEGLSVPFIEMIVCHLEKRPYIVGELPPVTLRESVREDFEALYAIFAESGVPMFELEDAAFAEENQKAAMRRAFDEYVDNQYRLFGFGIWTVLIENGEIAGWCGLGTRQDEPDLGYIIKKSLRRKGLASKASRLALRYAKEQLALERVLLYIRDDNQASLALARKLGVSSIEDTDGCTTCVLPL